MKPNWTHDCKECKFLGSVRDPEHEVVDLYAHERKYHVGADVEIITRFSFEPSDYIARRVEFISERDTLLYIGLLLWKNFKSHE